MHDDLLCHEAVILIVDDQISDIQLLGEAARGLGVVHFATSGNQALELASRVKPDLVLLDIKMRGMNGFELCEAFKSDPELNDAAIIFVTAHNQAELEIQALEMGGVDFLSKPVNIPVARARIRIHVRLKQMAMALANQDRLTRLPNRILLQDRITQAIHQARRDDERVALILLDLDNFKEINDSEGLPQGDRLLQQVANRLTQHSRAGDTVSRPGGDEFIILLPDLPAVSAVGDYAGRLLALLSKPFHLEERDYHLTGSIGVSVFPDDSNDCESILRHAETAMHQAKANGKNRYSFFSSEIESCMRARLLLERQIQAALDANAFEVFYQAKVEARQKQIAGVEALIRWRGADGHLIPPGDFIPLAEKTGQIIPMGKQVLTQACRDARHWREAGYTMRISVNISVVQLRDEHFIADVSRILSETGASPELIELEITEGVLATGKHGSQETLMQLKQLGVRIAIDDFGTGYSSLTYLKLFPVDVLKIDQGFVRGILDDHSDAVIIEAIIKMAQALDMELVAEGVETQAQEAALLTLGCTVMQGFLYCRPIPFADMSQLLETGITVSTGS
ncbi:EAL domain-containing protein [Oceanimonas sp. CHS3-5]|uniref:putative bifunctional diguanylate cyclase/phosphodiesterase n=1 Tax=Oceanimonas sp. CHS3-5 TaxID=3068186 RepID=UPI00273EDF0B|nr:EAL domain-containing protein [Oceanimonas sp. CHS3-5]MDP5291977.1 EAL domain-containing protein [Oceanimonas sp. CHS3-5]